MKEQICNPHKAQEEFQKAFVRTFTKLADKQHIYYEESFIGFWMAAKSLLGYEIANLYEDQEEMREHVKWAAQELLNESLEMFEQKNKMKEND